MSNHPANQPTGQPPYTQPPYPPQPGQSPYPPSYPPRTQTTNENPTAKALAIIGLVLSLVGLVLLPIIFGPIGLALGAAGFFLGERRLGGIAMIVGGLMTLFGVVAMAALVFSLTSL
jgi:hypothetical protein